MQGVVIFTAMRPAKTIKIFLNYFLGPLLFVVLAFSIFRQIRHQPHLAQSWQQIKNSFLSAKILYLAFALLLVPVNWGLEALKWKLLVNTIKPIKFSTAYKAVLSGVSFSVALPNRIGEYIGRMMYQPEGGRLKTISLSIVGSIAQLLATLLWGVTGYLYLKRSILVAYPQFTIPFQFVLYGLVLSSMLLGLFYFRVNKVVRFFSRWLSHYHFLYLVESLQNFNAAFLFKLFLLSSIRYSVFLLQYIAIFYLFGVDVPALVIAAVMSGVFLALAVIPSIALLEVGLRGEISLKLMALYSTNSLGIGLTSVTIWAMNLILPALMGTFFLLNIKLLSKNEKD